MEDDPDLSAEPLDPRIVVPAEAAGMRLDTWLSRLPGAPSRNRVQQLVKDGLVRVGGSSAKPRHELSEGDIVDIEWPLPTDDWPWPQDIPLDILHEDDEVIIVNKQADLVVHPSAGHPDGTLVNALLHHFPNLPGINGVKRPGIVHRIDRDTTGLMVIAKTERAMTALAKQLEARTVKRRYLALCIGDPAWEEIAVDAAIGRDPSNRLKRAIDGPLARKAISHFSVLRRSHQFALLRCRLETGRTHQIRIHLKHIGHPIVGDENYDGGLKRCVERLTPPQHDLKRVFSHFNRPWLHAHTLGFHHPGLDRQVFFQAPPPDDSKEVLRAIFGDVIDGICGGRIVGVTPGSLPAEE